MKKTVGITGKAVLIAMVVSAVFSVQSVYAAELDSIEQKTMEAEPDTAEEEMLEAESDIAEEEIIEWDVCSEDDEYQEEFLVSEQMSDEEMERIRDKVSGLPFGTAGRLYSEDIGINVKVEYYDMWSPENSNAGAQSIVNRKDTAIRMDWHTNTLVIADHWNQGFEAIKQSVPGETVIYLVYEGGVQKYICQNVQNGRNDGKTLRAEDGTDLLASDPGGVLLYTCDGNWHTIFRKWRINF